MPNACKNNILYYTFFDSLSAEALKACLRGRENGFGPMEDEETLFHPTRSGRDQARGSKIQVAQQERAQGPHTDEGGHARQALRQTSGQLQLELYARHERLYCRKAI